MIISGFQEQSKVYLEVVLLELQKKLQKISKETRKQKVNQDLLNRLNFYFEMTKNFIFFIVFMTLFYSILGIVVIIISYDNFDSVENI